MTDQDFAVREIFAYYGRAMYLAQSFEKQILSLIVNNYNRYGVTKYRFDEILHEKSSMTFGQLKREIKDLAYFSGDEFDLIDRFHEKRDFLAHSFWLERSVEFYSESQRLKLLRELGDLSEFFESLIELVKNKFEAFIEIYDLDIESIAHELISQGENNFFKLPRRLSKNETVIDLFKYRNSEHSLIPIFKLEDGTFWTVCDIGLTQFDFELNQSNLLRFEKLEGFLPINQFNPRPKIKIPWNYKLDLKNNGLVMSITKKDIDSPMKWKIEKS